MTTYTDRIVLVFPITAKNRQVAASLQTLEITESGKEFETLVPLNPALVNQYATEFNLGFEAEKAALIAAHKSALDAKEAALSELNATIAEKNQEINGLDGDIQALESQVEKLTEEKATLQADYDQLNAMQLESTSLVIELQAKVEALKQNQRFDPRQINAKAFYNRITKEEFALLAASPDPRVTAIAQAILAYVEHEKEWPVIFDSQDMQGMLAILLEVGPLTQERIDQLTADATWQEAFYAA